MTGNRTGGGRTAAPEDTAADRWLKKLVDLDVVVVGEPNDDLKFLLRELHALKMSIRHVWPVPSIMPQATDLLICDYAPDLAQRFAWLPGTPSAALIVLVKGEEEIAIDTFAAIVPDAILALPATATAIRANLMLAVNQFRYGRRMRAKVERLEDNILSLRLVERAKAIVMARKHIDDAEAYQVIRQLAMTKRVPVAAIATAIVDSSELLGHDYI